MVADSTTSMVLGTRSGSTSHCPAELRNRSPGTRRAPSRGGLPTPPAHALAAGSVDIAASRCPLVVVSRSPSPPCKLRRGVRPPFTLLPQQKSGEKGLPWGLNLAPSVIASARRRTRGRWVWRSAAKISNGVACSTIWPGPHASTKGRRPRGPRWRQSSSWDRQRRRSPCAQSRHAGPRRSARQLDAAPELVRASDGAVLLPAARSHIRLDRAAPWSAYGMPRPAPGRMHAGMSCACYWTAVRRRRWRWSCAEGSPWKAAADALQSPASAASTVRQPPRPYSSQAIRLKVRPLKPNGIGG